MAKLAPTRLAGTIAATALCVAAAAEASAQDRGLVLNEQLNLGDVISGQRLNVVNVSDNVAVSNAAMGNALSGGADGRAAARDGREKGRRSCVRTRGARPG